MRIADRVLAAALALQLLPLLLLDRVVTVDGPAHLLGGSVLERYGEPVADVVRRFYEVDLSPVPNLLTSFLLAGLLEVVGPDLAERLLVAAYVLLLVLGLRYALRGVDPDAGWLAVAALPFVGSYLFFYGFYNFCLALGLLLVVAGVALRRRDGWSPGAVVALALLLLLTWSAHLLPLLVAGLLVAVLAVIRALDARRAGDPVLRHLLGPALAGLPVLALTAAFLASPAAAHGAAVRRPLGQLALSYVTTGGPLVVYSPPEYVPAVAVTAVLVTLAVTALRQGRWTPERVALAAAFLLTSAAYFVSPAQYGPEYGFLNDRWSYLPPLFLLLAAAGPAPSRRLRTGCTAVLLVAALALVALRVPTEVGYQRDVAEMLSVVPQVPPGSTLLQVTLTRRPPRLPDARNRARDPLRHLTGRVAVLTGGVDLRHYEARLPYFPVRFRAGQDLGARLGPAGAGLDDVPPTFDLRVAAERVDVVLVVGRQQVDPAALGPRTRQLLEDLSAGYALVATSSRSRLTQVWVRR